MCLHPIALGGGGDSSLLVFKFSFVENKICEVFNGILVNVFHEGFDAGLWDIKVGYFINRVFVYNTSYTCCDSDEGVRFPSLVLYVVN